MPFLYEFDILRRGFQTVPTLLTSPWDIGYVIVCNVSSTAYDNGISDRGWG